jgi:hypothetical protein
MSEKIYPSRYSNGKKVSAAQYITELICEKKAKFSKMDLHYRFWLNPEWSRYYRNQIGSANKLLKDYSAKAIIKALNDKEAEKIYSLRAPHLPPIIEKCEKIVANENKTLTKPIERKDNQVYRKEEKKKNILSKLKELDNE